MGSSGSSLCNTVLTGQAALDTTHTALSTQGYDSITMMMVAGAGVASGAVIVEGAPSRDYAGTWAQVLAPVTVPAASAASYSRVVGPSAFPPWVRARISTVVGGGTIDVLLIMN